MNAMDSKTLNEFLKFQQDEADGSEIYKRLAEFAKTEDNRNLLLSMAKEEAGHYAFLRTYTLANMEFNSFKVARIVLTARLFGLSFTLKKLEKGEGLGAASYMNYPEMVEIAKDEKAHETKLLDMIDEEKLHYMGSVVLGLNDALVEFTGALAGYTLALGSSSLIALTGSITGIAAALSMSSSEYLSTKSDADGKHPVKAAIYTGIAYLFTVIALILPFVLINKPVVAVIVMLVIALLIIAVFNYYYTVARGETFSKRFGEMAVLSFSVAALSFLIGYLLKLFTGIDA